MIHDVSTGAQPAGGETKPSDTKSPDYYQVWNQALFDLVPTDCKRVLEVGCASGRLGDAIKKRNGGVHYVGVEVIAQAAEIAKARLDEVYVADVEAFDWTLLSGKEFDCIVFGDVLEHLLDPEKTLRNAARFLAEGGSVVCCLPNVGHWSIISGLIEGKWEYADSGLLDRTHLRFFTISTFRRLLEECGFQVVQEERLRNAGQLSDEIVPFLQKMNVDVKDFVDRVTTFQFLFRARRAAQPRADAVNAGTAGNAGESSWSPAAGPGAQTVAIVIPVFNKVELTRDCLASIARNYPQSVSPEVIVFDNASSDGTQAYLEQAQQEYEWLKVIRSKTNLGFAGANNKASELCDADILVFLNNDTIVQPAWLEKMLERIDDPGVGMVGSKLIYPDGRIQHAGIVFDNQATPTHIHHLAGKDAAAVNAPMEYPAVTGACIMIKRSLYMDVGQMDTRYPMYYEDVDLCFKVREKGLKVIYQPESMVIHLEGRSSANLDAIIKHNEASRVIFYRKWKDFMLQGLREDPRLYFAGKEYKPR
ncbi:MAG TPA: glycosyltransferase [Fibrobacteria bacterium]|nr:glycosyltransferase [Fibrobacteria bacterium]